MLTYMVSLKSLYDNYFNENRRSALRWILLIAITIYLTVSATPPKGHVEWSTLRTVFFWIVNGLLLVFLAVSACLSWLNAVKTRTPRSIGEALCSLLVIVLCLLFVLDIYNHSVFYTIKQFFMNL